MRPETRARVDAYWCAYFALPLDRLHEPGVTVTGSADGWPGIVVAGDTSAAHVRCLAAANLTDFDGVPADVGVVTHPAARGRGLGLAVTAAAARAAIATHGLARWRALHTNRASRALARRLGFTDYGGNLAVRLQRHRDGG
ncbi:MAG: GNAT family N-acetyltransferase [Nocardioidaceae bacterium]